MLALISFVSSYKALNTKRPAWDVHCDVDRFGKEKKEQPPTTGATMTTDYELIHTEG